MNSTDACIDGVLAQLTIIFQKQEHFLSTDHDFEDMSEWECLSKAWDDSFVKLQSSLRDNKLSGSQKEAMLNLVEAHHNLSGFVKSELTKLKSQIGRINKVNTARVKYEIPFTDSVFYDTRK
ncbi:hypothetical protein ACFQZT_19430 [Paenibacillus sp. GCM10027628]|uniref:hypothetical protein n=1 Tax=Paenibacillus sp. GCM10027628 TaxID=3273413 RepID=UPI00362D022E